MKSISLPVLIVLLTGATVVISSSQYRNPFEAAQGCLQYDNAPDYNATLEYFALDNFRHVGITETSKYIRVGMVGLTDGTIRYGNVPYPYEESVIEIFLAGLTDQKSEINRQIRTGTPDYINTQVKAQSTPNIMSKTRPLMFRLEVFDNGNIKLTKDGQKKPFMEFIDSYKLQLDYIAFSKWQQDVFYYYDCPLNTDSNSIDDTVLLKCKLA
uniref:Methyltransf_FA domain-containing protein n=1 Tax=Anopheles funestus TaxID=62324 RepID=A0A182RPT1_ANOFN